MSIRVEVRSLGRDDASYEINIDVAKKMLIENPNLKIAEELTKIIGLELKARLEEDLELGR